MENEIWRDIKNYEGLYQVSSEGRVKSLERMKWNKGIGCYMTVPEKILKPRRRRDGYLDTQLWKNGKARRYLVHRLVSLAFIQFVPQVNTSYEVDHINTERTDNRVSNLCYVTSSQNNLNPKTRERNINHPNKSKAVICIDKVTGLIVEFPSAHEAERHIGINQASICRCCQGKRKSAGGFYWHYLEDQKEANE